MSMTSLAVQSPLAGIVGASVLGAFLFAEITPPDYQTPGVIISVLFGFIGACSVVLYKVVLSPLFAVFIKNLENLEVERRKFLEISMELNRMYGENISKQNEINARIERALVLIFKGLRGKLDESAASALRNETPILIDNRNSKEKGDTY